jgi:methylmalonyl-CoA mutase, C-terminal domain
MPFRREKVTEEQRIKVLVSKPGLDGHDRGAKVVAHALKEAGMEVIYTGLHKTVDQIVDIAVQEDVDVIGLSIMSGAHIPIARKLVQKVKEREIGDKMMVIGGVIPALDVIKLKELGISGVFPGGTPFSEIVDFLRSHVKKG